MENKEQIFNKWCWHNLMSTCKRMKIDPYLSPYTKLKSKWIKDLNINPATLNRKWEVALNIWVQETTY